MTHELTPRELEVLALYAEGLKDAAIAHRLRLRVATVKWIGRSVRSKLGAQDRASAVHQAHRSGLLS